MLVIRAKLVIRRIFYDAPCVFDGEGVLEFRYHRVIVSAVTDYRDLVVGNPKLVGKTCDRTSLVSPDGTYLDIVNSAAESARRNLDVWDLADLFDYVVERLGAFKNRSKHIHAVVACNLTLVIRNINRHREEKIA